MDQKVKPLRAAVYTRVSTSDQSTDAQRRELLELCGRRQWTIQEFTDTMTGAAASRPGLDALMDACRRGRVDVVVVWKFDRFARSSKQLLDALADFDALGIQFVSHQEAIDTTTSLGRFFFQVVAAFAELERSMIGDRVRSGLAAAKARGQTLGRPRAVAAGDPRIAGWKKRKAAGESWTCLAQASGIDRATLRRILA
jgi:DNA invertase Pin-like site-specific DNA recombinase